jgi:hypothetical protein
MSMYCYEVSIELISTEEGLKSGHGLHALFCAGNDVDAVYFGAAWLKNRAKALGWEIGAINVSNYAVHSPEKDGFITSGSGHHFFEWKCDRPGTLKEYIDSFEADWHRKMKKEFEAHNPGKTWIARSVAGTLLEL